MRKQFFVLCLAAFACAQASARQQPQPTPRQTPSQPPAGEQQQRRPVPRPTLGLSDLGIEIAPEARLFAVMAALDAAGWDPTREGQKPSVFRETLRRDLAGLDPALRDRMRGFYQRYQLKGKGVTAAEQAARYVSLAYVLGPPPGFEAPARTEDLPAGVLDVLDFAPLLREFYQKTGMEERLPGYLRMHRAAGDEMREHVIAMARDVLYYLNTRPETSFMERVRVPAPSGDDKKKKEQRPQTTLRERERRFRIVPDLLAAPGAINFRVVGDDYFAVVPAGTDARLSEVRRAYLQFVFDPLVARYASDVAARRVDVKTLLDRERERGGRDITPDVFLTVARSLVAAADARMDELIRLRVLQADTAGRLQAAKDPAAKEAAVREAKGREQALKDSTTDQLAEAYERGAVLSFYFAEQLRGLEGSGFDISNFISAMMADLKIERELQRPAEYAPVVARVREARKKAAEESARERASEGREGPADERRAALTKGLTDVEDLLRVKNYEEAETRLLALREQHREEPRVYLALGRAASLAAEGAFDENLQAERLNRALGHYRQALLFSSPQTDQQLIARARLASGRILAHLERREEALKEFDAVLSALAQGDRLYQEALAEKRKLTEQQ
jgi:tetratricopeptide (TPR) repeat protein